MKFERAFLKIGMVVGVLLMLSPMVWQYGASFDMVRAIQAQAAAGIHDPQVAQQAFYQSITSNWFILVIGLAGAVIFTCSLIRSRRLSAAPPPLPPR